jgi:hypothetical protein
LDLFGACLSRDSFSSGFSFRSLEQLEVLALSGSNLAGFTGSMGIGGHMRLKRLQMAVTGVNVDDVKALGFTREQLNNMHELDLSGCVFSPLPCVSVVVCFVASPSWGKGRGVGGAAFSRLLHFPHPSITDPFCSSSLCDRPSPSPLAAAGTRRP